MALLISWKFNCALVVISWSAFDNFGWNSSICSDSMVEIVVSKFLKMFWTDSTMKRFHSEISSARLNTTALSSSSVLFVLSSSFKSFSSVTPSTTGVSCGSGISSSVVAASGSISSSLSSVTRTVSAASKSMSVPVGKSSSNEVVGSISVGI